MLLGPAGSSVSVVGGIDLRDEIYSWPSVNPCRIDQQIVSQGYLDPSFFSANLVNTYGLDALEYLLFSSEAGNSCPTQVAINSEGSWAALGDTEVNRRRASYTLAVATEVVRRTDELVTLWEPSGGNFLSALTTAGQEGSPYVDLHSALNALFQAMIYLETTVKDLKLATPLGLIGCDTETCPQAFESQYADHSLENIKANLAGLRSILTGGMAEDSLGFNELLVFAEHPELGDALLASLDATVQNLDSIDGTALQNITTGTDALLGVHSSIKTLADLLKVEVAMALFLELPQEAAHDND